MKKKILYVDMDDTICSFSKAILKLDPSIVTLCYKAPNYKERSEKVVKAMMANPRLFLDLEPLPGSIEAVTRLFEHYDVLFLSTPMWDIPESFMDKRLWIEKYFGSLATNRLILSQRKNLNLGDYLVDDRTWNGAGEFLGEHIHFGHSKFLTWIEVEEFLMKNKISKWDLINFNN